jgi:hypothetical protein
MTAGHCGRWRILRQPAPPSGRCESACKPPSARRALSRDGFLSTSVIGAFRTEKLEFMKSSILVEQDINVSCHSYIDHGPYADLRLQLGYRRIVTKDDA